MSTKSSYNLGLGQQILSKARLIFSSLLILTVILTIAAVHQGLVSGDFDKIFLKPFRQLGEDWQKAMEATPVPIPSLTSVSPMPSLIPARKAIPVVQPSTQTPTQLVLPNCIRKNIREGEFASNKCYSPQDYDDLIYYLNRYNSSVFEKDTQESFIKVTCPGRSEMFQKSCEEHKQLKAAAEADISKYKGVVQGIIAKGQ